MNNKERQDVRLFFRNFIYLLAPILLILFFPLYIFITSGEGISVSKVIKAQSNSENMVLYGLAYSYPAAYYKLHSVIKRRPDVITLGTSRVMQFRAGLFLPGVNFFNAGGGVRIIKNFRTFLNKIPRGEEPKIVIIGLDQIFFNYNWDNMVQDDVTPKYDYFDEPENIFLTNWIKIYRDFFEKNYSIGSLLKNDDPFKKIGLSAIISNAGFRNDGSHQEGNLIQGKTATDDFNEQLERFNKREGWFVSGNKINEEAVNEIDMFLNEAQKRGIYVVGFLPPYSDLIINKMKEEEGDFVYFFQLESRLKPIFEKYEFGFYNFSNMSSIESVDDEMIDMFHPSEKAVARLFLKMSKEDPGLKKITNFDLINERLNNSKNRLEIFND